MERIRLMRFAGIIVIALMSCQVFGSTPGHLHVIDDTLRFLHSSPLTGDHIGMHYRCYVPAAALSDSNDTRFPVIYFLPGYDGTPASIEHLFGFPGVLEEAMLEPSIPEFITVVVDPSLPGGLGSFYVDSPIAGLWETELVQRLTARIDKTLPTIRTRDGRMISGFSVGGFGAAYCGLRNSQTFGGIISISGALTPDSLACIWAQRATALDEWSPAYFISNCTRDDRFFYSRILMSIALCFSPDSNFTDAIPPFLLGPRGVIVDNSAREAWRRFSIAGMADSILSSGESIPPLFFSVGNNDQVVFCFGQEDLERVLRDSRPQGEWRFHRYEGSHGSGLRTAFLEGLHFLLAVN